jgi:hypothetical protein
LFACFCRFGSNRREKTKYTFSATRFFLYFRFVGWHTFCLFSLISIFRNEVMTMKRQNKFDKTQFGFYFMRLLNKRRNFNQVESNNLLYLYIHFIADDILCFSRFFCCVDVEDQGGQPRETEEQSKKMRCCNEFCIRLKSNLVYVLFNCNTALLVLSWFVILSNCRLGWNHLTAF